MMTKAKRLRLASRITWIIGCALTFYFIRPNPDISLASLFVAVIVVGVQYVFTQIESIPFEGLLTTNFRDLKNVTMMVFCFLIIMLDILINLGGIDKFMKWITASDSVDVLYSQYEVTDQQVNGFVRVFNFVLSAVVVLASEFLNSYADTLESRKGQGNRPTIKEH